MEDVDVIPPLPPSISPFEFYEVSRKSNIIGNFAVINFSMEKTELSPKNVEGILIKKCPKIEEAFKMLAESWFIEQFNKNSNIFIISVEVTSEMEVLKITEMYTAMKNLRKEILLILFENFAEKSQLFWKFKDGSVFWVEMEPEISNFLVNFLSKSMKDQNHSGISSDTLKMLKSRSNDDVFKLDISLLIDLSDFNLLMLASQVGDENTVRSLLSLGFDVDVLVCDKSAIDLAWENHHYETVLLLLEANSLYPKNFSYNGSTVMLRNFVKRTRELHNFIKKSNEQEISKILRQNSNLRYFYSTENISAAAQALLCRDLHVYKFLVSRNVYIGPKEDIDKLIRKLNEGNRENLRGIHLNLIQPWAEKHLMILVTNSFVGHDIIDIGNKLQLVKNAFNYLNEFSLIALILKVVAASRDFKIVFDFNRSGIQHLDPTSKKETKGIFYTTKHIYIAAKELFDTNTKLQVYGTMAHELCHYALLLVYKNNCKPYSISENKEVFEKFSKIASICESRRNEEKLIRYVFENYQKNQQHAELAVRVPHIIVEYSNNQEKVDSRREKFSKLFEFIENDTAVDMEQALPEIKSEADKNIQKFAHRMEKQKQQIIWLWIFSVLLILAVPLAIWMTIVFFNPSDPIYSCLNITDDARLKVFGSTIDFQGVPVIFSDLFGENHTACDVLSTDDIGRMIKIYDSGQFIENVYFEKSNFNAFSGLEMAEKYCKTSLGIESNQEIQEKYKEKRFRNSALEIGKKVELQTKFYIERKMKVIIDAVSSQKLSYSLKPRYIFSNQKYYTRLKYHNAPFIYINLQNFTDEFQELPNFESNLTALTEFLVEKFFKGSQAFCKKCLSRKSIIVWDNFDNVDNGRNINWILSLAEAISKLSKNYQWFLTDANEDLISDWLVHDKIYVSCDELDMEIFYQRIEKYFTLSNEFYLNNDKDDLLAKTLYYLFQEASKEKVHLLSDTAGSGKSTTFQHMAWELKRKFPLFWVSYVRLKEHFIEIKKINDFVSNLTTITEFLASKILNLSSKAELTIFNKKFSQNQAVFLWDAVDEISPLCFNEILQLIEKISNFTGNYQWISTRPQHENVFARRFRIPVTKLEPYDRNDRQEFATKFMQIGNFSHENTIYAIEKVQKFVKNLETRSKSHEHYQMISNPQMLYMICNAYVKNISLDNSTNLYTFYESYIVELFDIANRHKGDIVRNDTTRIQMKQLFQNIHHHYAIKTILGDMESTEYNRVIDAEHYNLNFTYELNIMKQNFKGEISRYGILFYKNQNQLKFEHRTFAEFFVAQYLYVNIFDFTYDMSKEEAEMRLKFLFNLVIRHVDYGVIMDFIDGFLSAYEDESSSFHPLFIQIMYKRYKDLMYQETYLEGLFNRFSSADIKIVTKFFKKDKNLLCLLWKAGEKQTLFHRIMKKSTELPTEFDNMVKIVEENFIEDDRRNIFLGKFQAINVLLRIWRGEYGCQIAKYLNISCQVLKELKTEIEISDFVNAQNYSLPYYQEFVNEYGDELFVKIVNPDLNFKISWKILEKKHDALKLWFWTRSTRLFHLSFRKKIIIESFFHIIENFLQKDEIHDLILYVDGRNYTFMAQIGSFPQDVHEVVWSFVEKHLNEELQKKLLTPILGPMIQSMIYLETEQLFVFYKKIFLKLFSKEELQEGMKKAFLKILKDRTSYTEYEVPQFLQLANFIEELFEGNVKSLRELFLVEYNNITFLQIILNETDKYKPLTELTKKVFDERERKKISGAVA